MNDLQLSGNMKLDNPSEQPIEIKRFSINGTRRLGHEMKAGTLPYFEVIWIMRGSGSIWIDDQKFSFEKGQLFCLRPGQVYQFEQGESLEGYSLRIWPGFLKEMEKQLDLLKPLDLLQLFVSSQGIHISKEAAGDLEEVIQKMIDVLAGEDLFKREIIQRYFEIFLMNLSRQGNGFFHIATRTRNIEIVDRFMTLLEKNFREKRMVSDYAQQLSITPNHLNEIVKKTTGNSAGQQIRQRIALEAKRHALHSERCMKEVAYYLGFYDLGHFSKFFKKETGKTFSEFRRERLIFSFSSAA